MPVISLISTKPVRGVLTTDMNNTDIPIRTKYPVQSMLTIFNPDNIMQNIFPDKAPIVKSGMNKPPGKPVALEMIVVVDNIKIINML